MDICKHTPFQANYRATSKSQQEGVGAEFSYMKQIFIERLHLIS